LSASTVALKCNIFEADEIPSLIIKAAEVSEDTEFLGGLFVLGRRCSKSKLPTQMSALPRRAFDAHFVKPANKVIK
jgi:hypothetical protein